MRQADHAQPYPDGTRVLHIGLPKTGTSSIQEALHSRRTELAQHGVTYASSQRHPYRAARSAIGKAQPWWPKDVGREWPQIAQLMRDRESRCVVFSSETLSDARHSVVPQLIEQLGGEVQVLITVRALPSLLSSVWQQSLRSHFTVSLPDWLDDCFSDSPSGKARHIMKRFKFDRYLEAWGSVVGEEALTFVIVDPTDRGMLLRSMEELLAVPEGTLGGTEVRNQSLHYPEAEFLRHFALAYEADGGDDLTWMKTVAHYTTNRKMQSLTKPERKHSVRVPRWAAERANETSLPWIEALRASDANVVGNLDHLLVDPDAYADTVEVPDTMRIDAAAELALILYQAARRRQLRPRRRATGQQLDDVPTAELLAQLRQRATRRVLGRG